MSPRRAVCALVFVLAVASSAQARPRSFALNWVRDAGAESCMNSRELARLIERAVGPVFAVPADAEFSIEGHVQRDQPAGWRVQIRVSDAQGERLGTRALATANADCRALNVQIGLVVVMIIDPEITLGDLPEEWFASFGSEGDDPAAALLAELKAEQQNGAPKSAPVSTVPPAVAAPRPPPASPRRVDPPEPIQEQWTVQAGMAVGSEFLANVSAGPWLGLGVRFTPLWSLGLRSVLWLPNESPTSDSGRSISFTMSLNSLSGCVSPLGATAIGWDICAGLSLGVRWSDTSALTRVDDSVDWVLGPSLSTQVGFEPVSRLTVLATFAVDLALRRPRFVYSDPSGTEQALFTAGRFAPWACLGAAWIF